MTVFKRIIAAILVALMMFSAVYAYTDVENDNRYFSSISKLEAFGIMTGYADGSFGAEESVSRAEATVIVARLLRLLPDYTHNTFWDVEKEYWAKGEIEAAANIGLVSGVSEGVFKPEDSISKYQAVVLLANALGYRHVAMEGGGHPTGYLGVAARKNLLSGIDYNTDEYITRGELAHMVCNSLECSILMANIKGSEVIYSESDNRTILNEYLDINVSKGQVTANEATGLSSVTDNVDRGKVRVGGEVYNTGRTDLWQKLGHNVKIYWRKDELEVKTAMFYEELDDDAVLKISAQDIDRFENNTLYYYNDGKNSLHKASVSEVVDEIFNGRYKATTAGDFKPENGFVELYDADGNGVYDVADIHSYATYVVSSVDLVNQKIYDKFGQSALDLDNSSSLIMESCLDNVLRFRMTKAGSLVEPTVTERLGLIDTSWGKRDFSYELKDNKIYFSNKCICFTFDMETSEFEFKSADGKTLIKTKNGGARLSDIPAEYSGMRTYTEFERIDNEIFSGFGARMAPVNRTGASADIFSEKGGTKDGDYGGFPLPYFISSRGYGVFFNNPWPHVYFDMAKTKADEWFINAPGGDYDIFVMTGENAAEIIKTFTQIVGRNSIPKRWHLGYWCSSTEFSSAEAGIENMERMQREGYPCDAIVFDGPWRGGKNFIRNYQNGWGYPSDDYNWHPDFGDGPGMIKTLEKKGIKTVLHINSCSFKSETAVPAIAKGLLRQMNNETIPDVASQKGIDYYKTYLIPRIKDGVKQWWTDHSDRISGEITQGIPSRNLFGVLWNRAITDIMEEGGIKNHMSLSRGGGIGSQKYAMPWAGDTEFGIHRFKDDIWYALNAGMAGFTMCGYDLGGFMRRDKSKGDANEEQFSVQNIARRMCQSMMFVPMPRMHNGDVAIAKWPWNCPEETRDLYRECLKFRYRFIPNIYSYAINGCKTGEPILRPLYYNDFKNERLYDINEEFYLGENILFAPVVEPDIEEWNVYLPAGRWANLWTKEVYDGEQTISVKTPLFEKEGLPIFVRIGGGVAYQEECLTLDDNIPNKLTIELYIDKQGAMLSLNEDENITNKFECVMNDGSIKIIAENNTDADRTYEFKIYKNGGIVGEMTVDVAARKTLEKTI